MTTYYFQPVRRPESANDFVASTNLSFAAGRLTNLCLDLNVLARIKEAMNNRALLQPYGLIDLASTLANPGIILNPGLAYREMQVGFVEDNRRAFNDYLAEFAPQYHDTPDATWMPAGAEMRSFWDIPKASQAVHLPYYVGQLLLMVARQSSDEAPLRRLESYLLDIQQLLGQFLPIEARIAQFIFYDRARVPLGEWHAFCGEIRKNFTKSMSSPERLRKSALNQMLDTYPLRAARSMHNRNALEGEFWIATQDIGLAYFARSFCYHADHRSPAGLYSAFEPLSPYSEMTTDQYWIEAEAMFDSFAAKSSWQVSDSDLEATALDIEARLTVHL